ncbi:MAG TPA: hypothetical protein VN973_12195 [Candidatus Dormibacteraeota bacterium]|nr:hypothetical protein [Candidatus Dormibacteraeota bacterium]
MARNSVILTWKAILVFSGTTGMRLIDVGEATAAARTSPPRPYDFLRQ